MISSGNNSVPDEVDQFGDNDGLRHRACHPDPSSSPCISIEAYGDFIAPFSHEASINGDDNDSDQLTVTKPTKSYELKQGTHHVPQFMRFISKHIPTRWINFFVRLFTTIILIGSFLPLIYLGPLALMLLVLIIQFGCFHEIITIGCYVYRSHGLPWFRVLSWYFLFTANYFLFGEFLIVRFRLLLAKEDLFQSLISHNQFISFSLYSIGIILFVITLVKKHYWKQFTLFGWTHVTLLVIVVFTHMHIQNLFNGIIWFLLPTSFVICNDILAYVCGFFFGKTPLIKLSPKKTWEGFIGGGLFTVVFGFLLSMFLVQFDYFVCPVEYDEVNWTLKTTCTRHPIFVPQVYEIPKYLFIVPSRQILWYPLFWHATSLSIYTSVIGPFGGFFASGFKRAFKIKDFGDLFPGHGGFMDRFDCQILTAIFTFIYYNSFVRVPSPSSLLSQIYILPASEQLTFYQLLTNGLVQRGVLPNELSNAVSNLLEPVTRT